MRILEDKVQKGLITRLSQGDEVAFNVLYKAYSKPLYLRMLRMVKNAEITDELLQDLFFKIWCCREKIDSEKSFQSYLYTIAQNLVYNYFRKTAHDQAMIQTLLQHAAEYCLNEETLDEDNETAQMLKEAIDQLSPQRKQVFSLCKIEGKSYEETGLILGISTATVNRHMTQSIRIVREYLIKNHGMAMMSFAICSAVSAVIIEQGNILH